jgi:RNA polymerase sigma-70 factor, ECF subfamily
VHYTNGVRLFFLLANMDLDEERELVRQAQKDPDAFAELYDVYYPKIFGYVLRRSANLEAAQDITSETFLKALRKLWQFQWRSISFSFWLYKIATNEVNQYFRKAEYKNPYRWRNYRNMVLNSYHPQTLKAN